MLLKMVEIISKKYTATKYLSLSMNNIGIEIENIAD